MAALPSLYADTPEEQAAVQQVKDAQSALQNALMNRVQMFDPTLLAISQALGSPTRTGSFGEVLGNVAGAVGTSQAAEEKRAQEIAKMRYELAQAGLTQAQQTAGMRMAREILKAGAPVAGAPAEGTAGAAPTGAPVAGAPAGSAAGTTPVSRLQNVTTDQIVALGMMPGMKQAADAIREGIKLDRERYKFDAGIIIDTSAPGGPRVVLDMRGGEQKPTEIVVDGQRMVVNMSPSEEFGYRQAVQQGKGKEYYDSFLKGRRTNVDLPAAGGQLQEVNVPLLGPDVKFFATPRQAAMIERLSEEALEKRNTTALREYVDSIRQGVMPSQRGAQGEALGAPQQQGRQQAPVGITSDLADLPLKEQNEEIVKRLSAADKPAQEQATLLMNTAAPQVTIASNRRLKEVSDLVTKNPDVVGLMNMQGLLPAMAKAAQEGLRVGQYSVSLPVTEALEKLKLSPEKQQVARRIAMLLDEEFFNRAQLAKSALGPQISNADANLMKSPMARPDDAAASIKYWAMHGVLTNKQLDDMYSALNQWQDQTRGKAPARQFFNKEGRAIMNRYIPLYMQLQDEFMPTGAPR